MVWLTRNPASALHAATADQSNALLERPLRTNSATELKDRLRKSLNCGRNTQRNNSECAFRLYGSQSWRLLQNGVSAIFWNSKNWKYHIVQCACGLINTLCWSSSFHYGLSIMIQSRVELSIMIQSTNSAWYKVRTNSALLQLQYTKV